ncbi:hypothetical protein HAX54_024837 [Datura stramonium]|uniref:Uncharacterized protein n=1 Tax=Datura stramonium TaxID=4076 RepID=A0ABS8UYQ6_DATST|nr:hypothetical protein [Datura stramonium]
MVCTLMVEEIFVWDNLHYYGGHECRDCGVGGGVERERKKEMEGKSFFFESHTLKINVILPLCQALGVSQRPEGVIAFTLKTGSTTFQSGMMPSSPPNSGTTGTSVRQQLDWTRVKLNCFQKIRNPLQTLRRGCRHKQTEVFVGPDSTDNAP